MKPAIYPIVVVYDRYSGAYSGAPWSAFNSYEIPAGPQGGDTEAHRFWLNPNMPVGKGETPDQAVERLVLAVKSWSGVSRGGA